MKLYIGDDRIQMIGKAWEIKHHINHLVKNSIAPDRPLIELIGQRRQALQPRRSKLTIV